MNLKKWIIGSVCISICFILCQSQTNHASTNPDQKNSTDYNLKDAQGRKYGLWLGLYNYKRYYKEDLLDGVCRGYHYTGKLRTLAEFKKGMQCGKWYYFDDNHLLLTTGENIKKNTEYTRMLDDEVITPEFTAYFKFYYPNGQIEEEGLVLFDEDFEVDYYKYGTWKYYDKEGNLTETKEEHE